MAPPPRATRLLNYAGVRPDLLPFVVRRGARRSKASYLPGSHIPILAPERAARATSPTIVLILPWNLPTKSCASSLHPRVGRALRDRRARLKSRRMRIASPAPRFRRPACGRRLARRAVIARRRCCRDAAPRTPRERAGEHRCWCTAISSAPPRTAIERLRAARCPDPPRLEPASELPSLPPFRTYLPRSTPFSNGCVAAGLQPLVVTGTCFEYGMQSGELEETLPRRPRPTRIAKDALRAQLTLLRRRGSRSSDLGAPVLHVRRRAGASALWRSSMRAVARGDRCSTCRAASSCATTCRCRRWRGTWSRWRRRADAGIVNVCSRPADLGAAAGRAGSRRTAAPIGSIWAATHIRVRADGVLGQRRETASHEAAA